MSEAINGQIVPALGQWHGTIFIITALAIAYVLRRLRRLSESS